MLTFSSKQVLLALKYKIIMNTSHYNVALITGATKGIGKEIAIVLAKNKYNLQIVGRNKKQLLQTSKELESYGIQCAYLQADLSLANTPQTIIDETIRIYGKLDVLINNAGLANAMTISETPMDLWDSIFAVNARAPFFICKAAIPYLKKSSKAVIINIGSVVDFKGYANQGVYASSKHALAGFTKVLAKEVQKDGIQVHLISPGGVNTEMVREMRPDIDTEALIQPQEIAELVEFILNRKGKGTIDHFYIRRQSGLAFD